MEHPIAFNDPVTETDCLYEVELTLPTFVFTFWAETQQEAQEISMDHLAEVLTIADILDMVSAKVNFITEQENNHA